MERSTFITMGYGDENASKDYLVGMLEDVRVTTIQYVEGISRHELDWVYHEGWNSVAALLSHMISNEHYIRIEHISNRDLTAEEEAEWMPGQKLGSHVPSLSGKPLTYYLDKLFESRSLFLEALETVTFEDLTELRGGYDPDAGYNLAWLFFHMIEDEVHHRGQISMIRKLYRMYYPN